MPQFPCLYVKGSTCWTHSGEPVLTEGSEAGLNSGLGSVLILPLPCYLLCDFGLVSSPL